jgi:glutamate-ammonia-ligase adenylyltransferase
MLQLAHGHRLAGLRQRETLAALRALDAAKILKPREYRLLADGYLFLRQLDHRLRLERDQSIDAFDAEPGRLDGIAKALGYNKPKSASSRRAGRSGQKLLRDYQLRRERIRTCYERHFVGQS